MCFGGGNQPIENQPVAVIDKTPPPQPVPVVVTTGKPTADQAPTNAGVDASKTQAGETGANRLKQARGVYDNVARFGERYYRTNTSRARLGGNYTSSGAKLGNAA